MNKQKVMQVALVCLSAFLGGIVSQQFLTPAVSYAVETTGRQVQGYYDEAGRLRLDLGAYQGQAVQDFYDEKGKARIQLGIYPSGPDAGQPFITLADKQGALRMLFRLVGKSEAPVMVFKDSDGKDRLVMGLDYKNGSQEPFLTVVDEDGKRHDGLFNDGKGQ